jgi:hypothetical protein
LLELADGDSVAEMESVTRDASGRPIACHRAWVRIDRLRLEIEVSTEPVADVSPPKLTSEVLL